MAHLVLSLEHLHGSSSSSATSTLSTPPLLLLRLVRVDSVAALREALVAEYGGDPVVATRTFYGSGSMCDRLVGDLALKRWRGGCKNANALEPVGPSGARLWSLLGGRALFDDAVVPWVRTRLTLYHADAADGDLLGEDLVDLDVVDWATFRPAAYCAHVAPGRRPSDSEDASSDPPTFELVDVEPYEDRGDCVVIGHHHVLGLISAYFRSRPHDTVAVEATVPPLEWGDYCLEDVPRVLVPAECGMAGVVVPSHRLSERQAEAVLRLFFRDRRHFVRRMSKCVGFMTACVHDVDAFGTTTCRLATFPTRKSRSGCRAIGFSSIHVDIGFCENDIEACLAPPAVESEKADDAATTTVARNDLTGRVRFIASDTGPRLLLLPELLAVGQLAEPPASTVELLLGVFSDTTTTEEGAVLKSTRQLAEIFAMLGKGGLAAKGTANADDDGNRPELSAGWNIGMDTQGACLRNAGADLRSSPPNPRNVVSIWQNSTIESELARQPLDCFA